MADKQLSQQYGLTSNAVLAGMVVVILAVMLLPLPTFLLDVLLVMNITGALVILFVSLYINRPLEFSVFPGLLLIVTLFRLSLNVATTRLILGQAYAGEIIEAFGSFVVSGNVVVGTVIFLILVIINFVVITKGAGRIAEVSARFTLDAMPGKQMAIDADLNAGLIDDKEAKERREIIANEADFHGSMDGASKFVRGDAVAGLLMTAINIIGGLSIGVLQKGMQASEAANLYTLLTIGDGLVAQIPALIISIAAGIIVTRTASEVNLGEDIKKQVTNQPQALIITSGVLMLLGIVPGLPFIPFALMGVLLGGGGMLAQKVQKEVELKALEPPEEDIPEPEDKIEEYLHPDAFEIEIGYGLIPLVDANQGGTLLERISTIRKSLAIELGVIVPPIRIRDNIQLQASAYNLKIYGIEVDKGDIMNDYFLVLNPDGRIPLDGIETVEPTFGLPAIWVSQNNKERAEAAGYTVVEAPAVIATHLMEVLRANAHKLLDRQEMQRMLDHLKETHSAVIDGLVPDLLSLGTVTLVLKNLLKEKIPVRNLVVILETLADYAAITKDADVLTEYVRARLAETITSIFKQPDGGITVATLDPRLEDHINKTLRSGLPNIQNLGLTPEQVGIVFKEISEKVEQMVVEGAKPSLLVSPQIRKAVRTFTEPVLADLNILSFSELTPDTNLKSIGVIRHPHGTN